MSKDNDWIDKRLTKAREPHPSVTDAAAARMKELLEGQVSERQLSTIELAKCATALIADMAPSAPPKADISHED